MYYLGRCSSEVVVLVPISYSPVMSIHYSNRFHIFFVCTHSRQKINTCLWVNKWGKHFSPQRAECFRPFIFHFGCFVQRSTLFHIFLFMIKPCIWCSTQEIMKNILNINVLIQFYHLNSCFIQFTLCLLRKGIKERFTGNAPTPT